MWIAGQLLLEATAAVSGGSIPPTSPPIGRCRIAPGMVRIREGRITEVIEGELSPNADAGGPQYLVSPGFVDTHLHLPQFDMIGAHGLPLLQWLSDVTFRAEAKWADVDYAAAMVRRAVSQCFSFGTTAICAYATVHHAATAAALRIASDAGMRGVIGQVLMDQQAPDSLCRPAAQLIEEAAMLLDRFPPGSSMAAAVTPRFAITCSAGLLADAGRLASERSAIVQTHLAETVPECWRVSELFDGMSYVDVYDRAGLMGPKSIFGHGIYLNEVDRRKIASAHSMIAHCPTANSFLRSGTMHRESLVNDHVAVTLGSDIGAGYERSMVRVGRAMIEAAASLGDHYPDAATAWHAITTGNANHLGWTDIGRIATGAAADLVLIKPDIPWLDRTVDPLSQLMFAWDDRWIERTWVSGTGDVFHLRS
jgi:guanine deaminase